VGKCETLDGRISFFFLFFFLPPPFSAFLPSCSGSLSKGAVFYFLFYFIYLIYDGLFIFGLDWPGLGVSFFFFFLFFLFLVPMSISVT
jgi:hypothetical protein